MYSSLPDDIALVIASSLQVSDVCSLGSCSRFWRQVCESDCVWASLCRDRWPTLVLDKESSAPEGWKVFYMNKHNEMAAKAANVINFVEQCLFSESMEIGKYLFAIGNLSVMQFGFIDVQLFFLNRKLDVLLNLVGLHYCINWLQVPTEYVMEALKTCKILERQVCVQWWKLGRWFYGFRLRDESHRRAVSLGDLAIGKEEEVFGVLNRGTIHEVLRVQISPAKPTFTPWSCQSAQKQE